MGNKRKKDKYYTDSRLIFAKQESFDKIKIWSAEHDFRIREVMSALIEKSLKSNILIIKPSAKRYTETVSFNVELSTEKKLSAFCRKNSLVYKESLYSAVEYYKDKLDEVCRDIKKNTKPRKSANLNVATYKRFKNHCVTNNRRMGKEIGKAVDYYFKKEGLGKIRDENQINLPNRGICVGLDYNVDCFLNAVCLKSGGKKHVELAKAVNYYLDKEQGKV